MTGLGHDHRYAMNSSKIREELGWAPRETLESGLARTVRWYIDNEKLVGAHPLWYLSR